VRACVHALEHAGMPTRSRRGGGSESERGRLGAGLGWHVRGVLGVQVVLLARPGEGARPFPF
jgi:hypothetical protein